MTARLSVRRRTLALLACLVWLAADINIARIGVLAYVEGDLSLPNTLLSVVVFAVFWTRVFRDLCDRHLSRMRAYQAERLLFLSFFSARLFAIMAVMMTGGIALRAFHLAPDAFVAFFYTGSGAALACAGVRFGIGWRSFDARMVG